MSWYQDRVYNITNSDNTFFSPGKGSPYFQAGKKMPITLTITDMNTQDDFEAISQCLLSLPGVTSVTPDNRGKKIVVHFDTAKMRLESIVYAIAKLGYHCLQRG